MNKIIIIIPYFGKFPNYFDLWLESVRKNSNIDFLLITDNNIKNKPNNIKIVKMNFDDCVNRIKSLYDFKVKIPTPYRLSTFKPAYGEIFEEEIQGYDFWGWCDMDLIFGDLRSFFTEDILEKYDKILTHGHLTLLRNNSKMRTLYRKRKLDCMNYKDAFSSGILFNNFDEYPYGLPRIADKERIKSYNKCIFADLDSFFFTFRKLASYLPESDDPQDIIQVFKWSRGKLTSIVLKDGIRIENEIAYVHFQKRKMQCEIKVRNEYMIIPNRFIDRDNLTNNEIIEICDLSKNKIYCDQLRKELNTNQNIRLTDKLFSYVRWKNRYFRFKMIKVFKIKPYIFCKGGF